MASEETGRKRRRSITKHQRETVWGAELLSICQTITEDGRLLDDEVHALKHWLEENESIDLPAKDTLLEELRQVLADGRITPAERKTVLQTIEAALPPDLRVLAQTTRRTVEAEQRAERQALIAEAKSEAAARRLRRRPLCSWDFMVAGVVYEGRAAVVTTFAEVGCTVHLARDPGNAFSKNAVEVRLSNGMVIGYVPEHLAVEVAPYLDSGLRHSAFVKKMLHGTRAPYPVVIASVYSADADLPDLLSQADVPARVDPPPHLVQAWSDAPPGSTIDSKRGCLPVLALLFLATAGAAIVRLVA